MLSKIFGYPVFACFTCFIINYLYAIAAPHVHGSLASREILDFLDYLLITSLVMFYTFGQSAFMRLIHFASSQEY